MSERGLPQLPNTDNEYSLALRHGISVQQAGALIREFNEGAWIADLRPFADSVEYIAKLANNGFRFIVVTSISSAASAKYYRTTNLYKVFGQVFDQINCIEMGENKFDTLCAWKDSEFFWIEDHPRQAEAGYEAGLKPILIRHPYNSHYITDLFPTVGHTSPWADIYRIVTEEYS